MIRTVTYWLDYSKEENGGPVEIGGVDCEEFDFPQEMINELVGMEIDEGDDVEKIIRKILHLKKDDIVEEVGMANS